MSVLLKHNHKFHRHDVDASIIVDLINKFNLEHGVIRAVMDHLEKDPETTLSLVKFLSGCKRMGISILFNVNSKEFSVSRNGVNIIVNKDTPSFSVREALISSLDNLANDKRFNRLANVNMQQIRENALSDDTLLKNSIEMEKGLIIDKYNNQKLEYSSIFSVNGKSGEYLFDATSKEDNLRLFFSEDAYKTEQESPQVIYNFADNSIKSIEEILNSIKSDTKFIYIKAKKLADMFQAKMTYTFKSGRDKIRLNFSETIGLIEENEERLREQEVKIKEEMPESESCVLKVVEINNFFKSIKDDILLFMNSLLIKGLGKDIEQFRLEIEAILNEVNFLTKLLSNQQIRRALYNVDIRLSILKLNLIRIMEERATIKEKVESVAFSKLKNSICSFLDLYLEAYAQYSRLMLETNDTPT